MRGRSPTRVYPQSGRISALAGREGREGREGRLRACTRYVQPED
ncbi:replication protein RepA4 [Shigella flexneri]|nr:replication protein RepA4 [Shigella boydii]EFW0627625.1 replication protein RepA4 [Shigella flexneri]EFW0677536.1 replication protein RepA4 [Shigella flexneri]EFW9254262.1 replication protein RepA4 [Shigella boydii]EFX2216288.1 replication protein RepA4 [Shigella flexneri]